MSIKYFCDMTGQELDLDFPIYENDRLDWDKKEITIYQDGIIKGIGIADCLVYCKEEALKKFPELQEDDFNSEIWE
tara:strand:+ start:315 stop:542 length:228 start_codon:yes stop_codon:yes gene_type:complete